MTGIDAIVSLNTLHAQLGDIVVRMAREREAREEALGLDEQTWNTDQRNRDLMRWQGNVSDLQDRINDVVACLRDIGSAELMNGCLTAIGRVERAAAEYTGYVEWSIPASAAEAAK